MTTQFERLCESPQTGVDIGGLHPEERSQIRRIKVESSGGTPTENIKPGSKFSTVYYVEGDEKRAIQKFIEVNDDILTSIEYSRGNLVKSDLDSALYTHLLHELGERKTRKYRHTVVEERPDGVTWVFDRDTYEQRPRARYSVGKSGVAKLPEGESLDDLYHQSGKRISRETIRNSGVEGQQQVILQFYVDCGLYECASRSIDGEITIIEKV